MSAFGNDRSVPETAEKKRLPPVCCVFSESTDGQSWRVKKLIHELFSHPCSADLTRQYAHQVHTELLEASEL